ncbi:hypothetical protein C2E23DRAFT_743611 [Lenzites betulinus]|nr:hypothetical protein C2E23DRAFT_743611 [Lenzites betulinus]
MSLANTPVVAISRPMPQQPRRRPTQLKPADRRKRYGVIFPTTNAPRSVYEDGDDESTWSMSRSRSSRRMSTSRGASIRTRNSSPAQEIAARYRASHASDPRPRPRVSSSVTYLDVPSTASMETELSDISGPRLRFRESRATAIDQAAREAYVMAIRWGLDRDIPCQRPGCRDVLPDMRSLAAHLTIHDIDPMERYVSSPPYASFLDLGHSVGQRPRRHYAPSPAPYACSVRRQCKIRKYLAMLACCSVTRDAQHGDF